jgi:holliday junction DNA helicase RuvA
MIGSLRGVARNVSPNHVLLDVQGVGYSVHLPLSTYYELQQKEGDTVALHVHTHVRDSEIALFGFWSEREKRLFEKLIAVSGIGPRLALVVLSGLPPQDLVSALASGDLARLTRIPGIGKKTAERMILELRDKVQDLVTATESAPAALVDNDLVLALENLGYRRKVAEQALTEVLHDHPDMAVPDLLRASLKRLSRA